MFFPDTLRSQTKWLVVLVALGLVGVIGWVDHVTGVEWSCFAPYAVPIFIATWKAGRRVGFAFAFLCALTYWMADRGHNPYATHWEFALAAATWWFYFSILVVAVTALKAGKELDRGRIETLERAQGLELKVLQASEREKQRIGRDLHDCLGPQLAAIGYAATFLANELRPRDPLGSAQADSIYSMLNEAVSHARDLAHGIFPTQMAGHGLSIALEELATTTARQTGMSVSFQETESIHIEGSEDGMHLYRIAQESLNNAAKHGRASMVTIILSRSEGSLRLAIVDDGAGMDVSCAGMGGMGLHSMRQRAQILGGVLHIDSNPGAGTVVSCKIPCRSTQSATWQP